MRMRNLWVLAFLIACEHGKGGGPGPGSSGLDSNEAVSDLDATELDKLCAFFESIAPEPHTITCPNGDTVTIDDSTRAECVQDLEDQQPQFEQCGLTVGEFQDCAEQIAQLTDDERCSDEIPPECNVLLECAMTPTDEPPPEP